jgi:hypothetical protein
MTSPIRNCVVLLLALGFQNADAGESQIDAARSYLTENYVFTKADPTAPKFAVEINEALKGRDAETKTMSFIHGIRRHAKKLLSADQSPEWERLLASRQAEITRLHDERNVLRGLFFSGAWELPALDITARGAKSRELHGWLRVWLDITLQERMIHHRLCRDAWEILTPAQRLKLSAGDWDVHVRKSTGHKRDYFGDKIVSRLLGKPDRPKEFSDRSKQFATEHIAIQKALLDAERRWRILTLRIPSVPDELLVEEWRITSRALGDFFLSQARAIDELTRIGFDLGDAGVLERVRGQRQREVAELVERVRDKLRAGSALLSRIRAAGK